MATVIDGTSTLLNAVTATGAGTGVECHFSKRSFQARVVGTGAVTATVVVEVQNDSTNWGTLGTFTLSGTTSAQDFAAWEAPWLNVRGNVTAISGTSAAVTLTMNANEN